ncbi:MAG TPA: DUF58 domain-containing protein [Candidatus Nanoarchaeia archaeon]|nr:DUF58 domain-containing protein [Candidatus Nanoarchaeia archaeon]
MTSLDADIPGSIAALEDAARNLSLKTKLYRTLLRGKGVEFDGYREYASDDDASVIDWKASKRSNSLLVKQYREERDLKILFAVDCSERMLFGSGKKLKAAYAAEVSASLAHLFLNTGDKIGFLLFNTIHSIAVPVSRGINQFYFFVDNLLNGSNYSGNSGFHAAFETILNSFPMVDVLVLVSDFYGMKQTDERLLGFLGGSFECLSLVLRDRFDLTLPSFSGQFVLQDPNTGEQVLINPKIARQQYTYFSNQFDSHLRSVFSKKNIDSLFLKTDDSFILPLSSFLSQRVGVYL